MTQHNGHDDAFPRLDEAQLAILDRCPLTKRRRYADGEKLFELGDRDFKFFVVKSGRVEILDESGEKPVSVAILGPGEFTGDEAQVTGGPTVVSAVARGDSEVYEVSNDALRQILNLHPDLGDVIMRGVHRPPAMSARVESRDGPRRDRLAFLPGDLPDPRLPGQESHAVHLAGPGGRPPGETSGSIAAG